MTCYPRMLQCAFSPKRIFFYIITVQASKQEIHIDTVQHLVILLIVLLISLLAKGSVQNYGLHSFVMFLQSPSIWNSSCLFSFLTLALLMITVLLFCGISFVWNCLFSHGQIRIGYALGQEYHRNDAHCIQLRGAQFHFSISDFHFEYIISICQVSPL